MLLIFNILTSSVSGAFVTYTPNKAPIATKLPSPQLLPQFREILKYLASRHVIYSMLCAPNPHADFIQEKALFRQAFRPRLMASHFVR
jgi:hypothetical protein